MKRTGINTCINLDMKHCLLIFCAVFLTAPIVFAEENVDLEQSSDEGFWWLSTHAQMSQTVNNWSNGLDTFLSGEKSIGASNQSFVSLQLGTVITESGTVSPFFGFLTRIRLPNTKDRLRLIIESDADQVTANNQTQESTSNNIEKETLNESFSAAIRFVKQEWNANIDAGVLIDFPLDPFAKIRFAQRDRFSEWRFEQTEQIFSYYSQGFGANYAMNLERSLDDRFSMGMNANASWLKRDDELFYREDFYLNQSLVNRRSLRYQFSVLQSGNPDPHLDSFLYFIRYQQPLYKNWLIGKVTPQFTHTNEANFAGVFSISLAIEMLFGEEYLSSSQAL